jgi:hypothetical protein
VVGVGDGDDAGGGDGFLERGYLRFGQRSESGGVGVNPARTRIRGELGGGVDRGWSC